MDTILSENDEYTIHRWYIGKDQIVLHVTFKKKDVFHGFVWHMRIGFDYMSGTLIFPASQFGCVSSESGQYRKAHNKEETERFYKKMLAFMDITEYEYHDGERPYCTISLDTYKNVLTLWKMTERC